MTATRGVVVVTGASAGVGRATALKFAQRGFDVALLARGEAGLAGAAAEVERAAGRPLAISVDVSSSEEVERAADRVELELGPIDVWVNNAMTTVFAPVAEISAADFRRAIEVTFLGQVWGTTAALTRMKPRNRGAIVNVGSALAFMGIPLQAAYCASKFACRGFFEAARAELLHEGCGVTMSMVHLPAVNTPQFEWCATAFSRHPQPVAPIYQPEVCANAIVDAALTGNREKVLGAWNKLLVAAARSVPGIGNQFAAIGAWDEQLADRPLQPGRPCNLHAAADTGCDYGSHGTFDDRAQGSLTPSFLTSLPRVAKNLARALSATGRERRAVAKRRVRAPGDSLRVRPATLARLGHGPEG